MYQEERLIEMGQDHGSIRTQHDGNISYVIDGMVAHVYHTARPIPENDKDWTNEDLKAFWEEAEEKYVYALGLRDLSGFKDAATIRQHLEQMSEQYG